MHIKTFSTTICIILLAYIVPYCMPYSNALPAFGGVNELVGDSLREIYVLDVSQSSQLEVQNKLVSIEVICKNLQSRPSSCWDYTNFELLDRDGRNYQPNSGFSEVYNVRIAPGDTVRGIVAFVMTSNAEPGQLIFHNYPSQFKIDLTQSKKPADVSPQSSWSLQSNSGIKADDGIRQITIITESISSSQYTLDIVMKNIAYKEIQYNFYYLYVKDERGFIYRYPHIPSNSEEYGNLQPGQEVRATIGYDVRSTNDSFMVVYDDGSSSFVNTGNSLTKPSSSLPKAPVISVASIKLNTDRSSYVMGETVKIKGNVSEVSSYGGFVYLLNSKGEIYSTSRFYPSANGNFTVQFELTKQSRLAVPGLWTAKVAYLSGVAETTFTVTERALQNATTVSQLTVSKPKLVDESGQQISVAGGGNMVGIESEVANTASSKVTFTLITQIKDKEGVTVFLFWVENLSVLPNDSVKPSVFWSASADGEYNAEVFVWESLGKPVPLAPVGNLAFSVK